MATRTDTPASRARFLLLSVAGAGTLTLGAVLAAAAPRGVLSWHHRHATPSLNLRSSSRLTAAFYARAVAGCSQRLARGVRRRGGGPGVRSGAHEQALGTRPGRRPARLRERRHDPARFAPTASDLGARVVLHRHRRTLETGTPGARGSCRLTLATLRGDPVQPGRPRESRRPMWQDARMCSSGRRDGFVRATAHLDLDPPNPTAPRETARASRVNAEGFLLVTRAGGGAALAALVLAEPAKRPRRRTSRSSLRSTLEYLQARLTRPSGACLRTRAPSRRLACSARRARHVGR